MLQVSGLCAGYGGGRVLDAVDFTLRPGEIVALLGRNGAGRSTLVKALMGQLGATGSVRWQGRELLGLPPFEIARAGVGWVPEGRDVFASLTVEQNLLLGLKRGGRAAPGRVAEAYGWFPVLAERRRVLAGALSGGEQQMLSLARTLLGEPGLLLVDEPTEGLAPRIAAQVAEQLLALRARGLATLLVEQKLDIALAIADRCLVMGRGRIVHDGTPASVQADAALRREWLEV